MYRRDQAERPVWCFLFPAATCRDWPNEMIDVRQFSLAEVAQGALRKPAKAQGILSVEIQSGLHIARTDFVAHEGLTYEAQSFPMAALSVMLNGRISTDIGKVGDIASGDLFIVTNSERRVWRSQIGQQSRVHNIEICLTPDWFSAQEDLLRDDPSFDEVRESIERPLMVRRRPLTDRVRQMALEAFAVSQTGLIAALKLEARTLDLVIELASSFQHGPGLNAIARDRDRVFAVREAIERNPAQPSSLSDLAERHGVSASKLKRDFMAVFGTCIGAFINERRMMLSRQLLEEGMSVSQVAYRSGYGHPSNFSTAFRRRFGMAPRELLARSSRAVS